MGEIFEHDFDVDGVDQRTAREVLLVLAEHSNSRTGLTWPSVATIAREMSVGSWRPSERTVQRALAALRAKKVLVRVREPGFHRPATYMIALAALPRKGDAKVSPSTGGKGDVVVSPMTGDARPKKDDGWGRKGDCQLSPEPPSEPPYEPFRSRESGRGLRPVRDLFPRCRCGHFDIEHAGPDRGCCTCDKCHGYSRE